MPPLSAPARPFTSVRPSVNLGRILFAAPCQGWYQIAPYEAVKPNTYIYGYALRTDGSMTRSGTASTCSYSPGDEVLYMSVRSNSPHEKGFEIFEFVIILGCFPWRAMMNADNSKLAVPRALSPANVDNMTHPAKRVFYDAMSDTEKNVALMKSFGRVGDAMAGEFVKVGAMGTAVQVGAFKAMLRASAFASLEMNHLDDSVLLMADSLSVMNSSVQDNVTPTDYGHMRISRLAYTSTEGCGAYSKDPFKKQENGLYLPTADSSKRQQGIFRMLRMEGWNFGGVVDAVISPEKADGAVRTSDVQNFHKPVLVEHRALNGSYALTAATRVRLARTPMCVLPMERDTDHETDRKGSDDSEDTDKLENFYSSVVDIPDDDRPDYSSLLADKAYLHEMTRYFEPVKNQTREWWTYAKDEWPAKLSKADFDDETTIPKALTTPGELGTADVGYKNLELKTLSDGDPTGRAETQNKLTALLQAIEMTPDGAVVIHDGCGSEIRMHRGNITVAPGNDLRLVVGRDMVVLAGRNSSITAHNHAELASEKGKVLVKAEQDMMLLSGNGGRGVLLLENRSSASSGLDEDKKISRDEPWSDGVVLKTKGADMAIVSGGDLRIGLKGREGAAASKKGTDDDVKTGTIVIDAGKGNVAMRCGMTLFHALTKHVIMAARADGSSPAAFVAAPSSLGLLCQGQVNVGASLFNIGAVKGGSVELPVITKNGVETKRATVNVSSSFLRVNGGAQIHGTMQLKQSLLSEGSIMAKSMFAEMAMFGNASKESNLRDEKFKVTSNLKPMEPLDMAVGSLGAVYERFKTSGNLMSDLFVSMMSFAFLDDDQTGYNTAAHFMVKARWQDMMERGGVSSQEWEHTKVKNWKDEETSQFPGQKAWETRDDYVRALQEADSKVTVKNVGALRKITRGPGV